MESNILDRVLTLNQSEIFYYLNKLNIELESTEDDGDIDIAELQGILFSFCSSVPNFDMIFEISESFNESFEMVNVLLESTSGRFTMDQVYQLLELQAEENKTTVISIQVSRHRGVIQAPRYEIDVKSMLVVAEEAGDGTGAAERSSRESSVNESGSCVRSMTLTQLSCTGTNNVVSETPAMRGIHTIVPALPFGVNEITVELVRTNSTSTTNDTSGTNGAAADTTSTLESYTWKGKVFATSATYRYTAALDRMLDRLYWGWEGENQQQQQQQVQKGTGGATAWTEALEHALLELLIAVDDDLVALVRSWTGMFSSSSSNSGVNPLSEGAQDMQHMLETVTLDVQNALNGRSPYAVGRLHQTLVQFIEMKSSMPMMMSNIPEMFVNAINNFISAKLAASVAPKMRQDLAAMVSKVSVAV